VFDDLDDLTSENCDGVAQSVSHIVAINKDIVRPRTDLSDRGQHLHCIIAALDISEMDAQPNQMALRIGDYVGLTTFDLFASIKALRSAAFRRLNRDWLQITLSEALAFRPTRARRATRAWLLRSNLLPIIQA